MSRRLRLSAASFAWLVITALLIVAGLVSLGVTDGRQQEAAERQADRLSAWPAFDLQAHRAGRGLFPENSLPAVEGALAIGVTTLELDLVMSAEGKLLVHHDPRLDPARTRGSDGAWLEGEMPRLLDLTAGEAARYDIGRMDPASDLSRRFLSQQGRDGVSIPTLEEVLAGAEAISGGEIRYNLETKLSPLAPAETAGPQAYAEALASALEEAGVTKRAMVQSFDWRSLEALKALQPEIARAHLTAEQPWLDTVRRGEEGASPWLGGLDVEDFRGSVPRMVEAAGGDVWSPYFRDLRPADLEEAHSLGLKVVVWTVNDPGVMHRLMEDGVDGIITDYPDRLRAVMEARGLDPPPAYRP